MECMGDADWVDKKLVVQGSAGITRWLQRVDHGVGPSMANGGP